MRASERTRSKRGGFTLVELMIAVLAGGITVTAAYYLGSASSKSFNNQMRTTATQSSLRSAMDQLRRDVTRAGFLSTPEASLEQNCLGEPTALANGTLLPVLRGASVAYNESHTLSPASATPLRTLLPDTRVDGLRMFGNYDDGDVYKITPDSTSSTLFFEANRESFRRSFVSGLNDFNAAHFNEVFRVGRIVRIDSNQHKFFRQVAAADSAAGSITLDAPVTDACFNRTTALVTPLSFVRYNVEVLTGADFARIIATNSARPGSASKAALVRREFDYVNGSFLERSARVVLDYAVEFEVSPIVPGLTASSWATQTPPIAHAAYGSANLVPRGLRVTLSGRSEDVDATIVDPPPRAGPLLVFPVSIAGKTVYARVRTLRQEFFLPNMGVE
ncbi:MAG: prepilin-type N-terminal cleavage/methylation domain-containing protein [Myxococcales bacterium]